MKVLLIGILVNIKHSKKFDNIVGEQVEFIAAKDIREAKQIVRNEDIRIIQMFDPIIGKKWRKVRPDNDRAKITAYPIKAISTPIPQQIRETLKFYQSLIDEEEEELQRLFGDKTTRIRKERRYINKLVKEHPEKTIRDILKALACVEDFIPAEILQKQDLENDPLNELFRYRSLPWFYFEGIRQQDNDIIDVDVSHGINEAAEGVTFTFYYNGSNFELRDRISRWNS